MTIFRLTRFRFLVDAQYEPLEPKSNTVLSEGSFKVIVLYRKLHINTETAAESFRLSLYSIHEKVDELNSQVAKIETTLKDFFDSSLQLARTFNQTAMEQDDELCQGQVDCEVNLLV